MLQSVGWPLLIIGLPIFLVMLLSIFERSATGYSLAILYSLAIFSLHISRQDHFHLKLLGYNHKLVFFIEYSIIGLILGILNLLLVGNWMNLGIIILVAAMTIFIPSHQLSGIKPFLHFPVSWISTDNFEWRSGFRKTGWIVFIIIIIGCIFCYRSPIMPLIAVVLTALVTTSWYEYFEPMSIFGNPKSSFSFLIGKIFDHIKNTALIVSPIIIIFLVYYVQLWYLLLVALIFGLMINSFAIFYKYAGFHPSRSRAQGELAIGIFTLCSFIPFFAPVCLVYLIIYAKRAVVNINNLNAHY